MVSSRPWFELPDALSVLKQTGALRDLSGWEVTLVLENKTDDGWGIHPEDWITILIATGADSYMSHLAHPEGVLNNGEVVVFPDIVTSDLFAMSQRLVEERPVLTETQLARWVWADDIAREMGHIPYDPVSRRVFPFRASTMTTKDYQRSSSRPAGGPPGGPSSIAWW